MVVRTGRCGKPGAEFGGLLKSSGGVSQAQQPQSTHDPEQEEQAVGAANARDFGQLPSVFIIRPNAVDPTDNDHAGDPAEQWRQWNYDW